MGPHKYASAEIQSAFGQIKNSANSSAAASSKELVWKLAKDCPERGKKVETSEGTMQYSNPYSEAS